MQANDSVEVVLKSIASAERHINSEYGTQMVGVMDTVGAHPHFAMVMKPGVVKIASGRPEIDELYKASVDFVVPQSSRLLSQIATDWYVFIENVPTRMWATDGTLMHIQTVTTFVTDDADGISGEYAWQRYFPAARHPDDGTIHLPQRALDNLAMHEQLIDAICVGDLGVVSDMLDPACIWATRDYLSDTQGGEVLRLQGVVAAAEYIAGWHAALKPEHVSVLNRKVTDWYIFAEELWVVRSNDGQRRQCRTVAIYPVNASGKIEGALGFGRDMAVPAPSAGTRRGRAFWPQPRATI